MLYTHNTVQLQNNFIVTNQRVIAFTRISTIYVHNIILTLYMRTTLDFILYIHIRHVHT